MSMRISEEQLRELARAAQLSLTDAEVGSFADDLESLFSLADVLKEVPLRASERGGDTVSASMNMLREDLPHPCLPREELLRAASRQRDGYIVVPRAVEE